jgi:hypothetical protein
MARQKRESISQPWREKGREREERRIGRVSDRPGSD